MKICLFDWNEGGHHAEVAKAFARALDPGADVVLAAPAATLESAGAVPAETFQLASARPRPQELQAEDRMPGSGQAKAVLAEEELDLIDEVVAGEKPDHLVLLWADPVLRWLLRRPPMPTAVSLYIAFAQLHYPFAYRTPLSPKAWGQAAFKEANLVRWSRRRDAHALFALDPLAGRRWARYPGVRSFALDETPLNYLAKPRPISERRGCMLFGQMDKRKGIERIADALGEGCEDLELKLYGNPVPDYEKRLLELLEKMRSGGVRVDAQLRRLPYAEAMDSMAASRVALLSFGWVPAGSRVLLEAAAAGTPVIGSNQGAVGYLIRKHRLGISVSPSDTAGLRGAIQELTSDISAAQSYGENLRAYAERLDGRTYRREIRSAFGLPQDD